MSFFLSMWLNRIMAHPEVKTPHKSPVLTGRKIDGTLIIPDGLTEVDAKKKKRLFICVCVGDLGLSSLKPDAFVCFFFFFWPHFSLTFCSWHQKPLTVHLPAGPSAVTSFGVFGVPIVRGCPVVLRRPSVLGPRLCRSFVLISADELQWPDSLSADLEQ